MSQYFKRQLKTPTCFGSFGIHPQGILNVLHWNYFWYFVCVVGVRQREIWTCGVCVWCDSSNVRRPEIPFPLHDTLNDALNSKPYMALPRSPTKLFLSETIGKPNQNNHIACIISLLCTITASNVLIWFRHSVYNLFSGAFRKIAKSDC